MYELKPALRFSTEATVPKSKVEIVNEELLGEDNKYYATNQTLRIDDFDIGREDGFELVKVGEKVNELFNVKFEYLDNKTGEKKEAEVHVDDDGHKKIKQFMRGVQDWRKAFSYSRSAYQDREDKLCAKILIIVSLVTILLAALSWLF